MTGTHCAGHVGEVVQATLRDHVRGYGEGDEVHCSSVDQIEQHVQ